MGHTAENLAEKYGIDREESDRFALRSHELSISAWDAGRYDDHVVAAEVPQRKAEPVLVQRDEGPHPGTSMEAPSSLRHAFRDDGTVTAGNASSLNDGAGAMLLASERALARWDLQPPARVVASGRAGVAPSFTGIGPVPATDRALRSAGWELADLDTIELTEAFAGQCLAVLRAEPVAALTEAGDGVSRARGVESAASLVEDLEPACADVAVDLAVPDGRSVRASQPVADAPRSATLRTANPSAPAARPSAAASTARRTPSKGP